MILGLTGGIASGKSTVARIFTELGAYLIDWDVLAHEVAHPYMRAWEGIVEYFGMEVLNQNLTIDRVKLGEIAFSDREKLERLNQIVHPEIFKEDERITNQIRDLELNALIIKDIPLLTEAGRGKLVDKILVVYSNEESQLKRLMERGFTLEEARKRILAQVPLTEKVKSADFVIYNDGSFEETRKQVERIYNVLSLPGGVKKCQSRKHKANGKV